MSGKAVTRFETFIRCHPILQFALHKQTTSSWCGIIQDDKMLWSTMRIPICNDSFRIRFKTFELQVFFFCSKHIPISCHRHITCLTNVTQSFGWTNNQKWNASHCKNYLKSSIFFKSFSYSLWTLTFAFEFIHSFKYFFAYSYFFRLISLSRIANILLFNWNSLLKKVTMSILITVTICLCA